jgi:hypothetical protein
MKGEAEESALTAAEDLRADVEKWFGEDARAVEDEDLSLLRENKQARVIRMRDADRLLKSADDRTQRNLLRCSRNS